MSNFMITTAAPKSHNNNNANTSTQRQQQLYGAGGTQVVRKLSYELLGNTNNNNIVIKNENLLNIRNDSSNGVGVAAHLRDHVYISLNKAGGTTTQATVIAEATNTHQHQQQQRNGGAAGKTNDITQYYKVIKFYLLYCIESVLTMRIYLIRRNYSSFCYRSNADRTQPPTRSTRKSKPSKAHSTKQSPTPISSSSCATISSSSNTKSTTTKKTM